MLFKFFKINGNEMKVNGQKIGSVPGLESTFIIFLWYFNLIPHGEGKKKASLLHIETWLAQKFGVQ